MANKKRFVLRIDEKEYEALERWAQDEFRSVNGQLEFILHEALRKSKRLPKQKPSDSDSSESKEDS